jgi:hypothetical protein
MLIIALSLTENFGRGGLGRGRIISDKAIIANNARAHTIKLLNVNIPKHDPGNG